MNGRKRTPGSNEQSGIQVFNKWQQENAWLQRAIWKTRIFNKLPEENAWHKRATWNTEIWNTQIINKWPQENAWLKRAIWNTQICNKWPQENAWLQMTKRERLAQANNMKNTSSINCQKRTPGSNEQYGIQKYGTH